MKIHLLYKATLLLILLSFNYTFAELKVTSNDPNFGVGNSYSEFNKTWLCENIGTSALSVTLTSKKSGRSPESWGLNNLSESFNLEAGGTQNCGIKLTTGTKGIGDVEAQIKTNDGFERNVNMTFYTDLYDYIIINGSEGQDIIEGSLYDYFVEKELNFIEMNKNDFNNLSPLITEAKSYIYNNGSNGDIDSLTAERLANLYLNGKNVFICGAEPFYKLSKSHPDHIIWSILRFDLTDEIIYDNYNKAYDLTLLNLKTNATTNTTNLFLDPFVLSQRPIRKVMPRITDAMQNTRLFYLNEDNNKVVGYTGELGTNEVTFINVDLEGLFYDINDSSNVGRFFNIVFGDKYTSVEDNETNNTPKVIAYPNPVSEFVNIPVEKIINLDNVRVNIYDNNSVLIKNIEYTIENQNLRIKTNNLPQAKYFVEIYDNDKILHSNFIIIK